ncbi:hypothetical protein Srot_1155 [Segniliparus rotundus DSM 44985]|uniref:Uncharacterized protein n=2 Tax=Segniliparus rotundus TaxID=286802 RepID=D6ZFA3_SEGRD|nr:hypothetical protein Srot_1155 [Segniliparus rotundus DSM 44985]
MRGDTAGGASGVGQRAEEKTQALLGSVSSLSRAELASARSASTLLQGALSGLGARVAQAHPVRDAVLGELIASGGVVEGAAVGGLLPSGVWGRIAWPGVGPVEHPGLDGVGFVFADMRVAPNEAAGVSRPTTTRVTTTGAESEIEPALRLPLGTRLLGRSQAPAGTEFLTDAGLLAVGLAKWLLERGLDGDSSWRLVAVCFTKDPGTEVVDALLRLRSPVEAYWPDRAGYEERLSDEELRAAQTAATDAQAAEGAQREDLALKGRDPLAHAKAAMGRAPNEPYPAEGLPEKEASWHAVCRENNKGALPTAR